MLALAVFTTYVVMDTFVISRVYGEVSDSGSGTEAALQAESDNDKDKDTANGTDGSAADDAESSGSHGPGGKHGKGNGGPPSGGPGHGSKPGKSKSSPDSSTEGGSSSSSGTSGTSTSDSYSDDNISIKLSEYTEDGVIRNGKLYRSTAVSGREDLVIYEDGTFEIINESEVTADQLMAKGAVQTLSFGPALIENGTVSVDGNDEVGRAMASNPRTAIGIKADGTYLFVVSDGRTEESEGLSLLQLAEFMKELGAETAYNLDGGGSSTMVFNGSVVNTPTGGGIGNGSGSERKVSDIVYIGY